ncbi:MAG: 23S rRNA (uracil(1939)-C(5))-methyltransferase RlmD [Bacteroidota bacterium]|nr:23S rRNA (uracil(1939)-C(5))-methyltransferase RlmD [Bacteroidota bacterium]MDP4214938.1 23S rRNA (uracil(1939)-C(5))-methyltransferase RlmD [Bacteroidota bacterium]MDP4246672.1 23S rRNA (uracil(1939)-C(5))-methyltransferase RlmD [Bacteroidota bacterium]MDP4254459.1 23S rRNA (uracil(1939)-C(5))-methyltransferase RlmD [Bacteroidota bacterium]MDP4258687.1 23S rRNA (uracil(1939)-C(5))-methyltransferase RlmD [Bacteroidota bacterium]
MSRKNKNTSLFHVLVEDYAAEGRSLARVDGKVIFIENAIPGDIVDLKLSKNKKDWAEGHITAWHQYSPDRVEPFCSHFGVCGGCRWQMLPYAKQLQYKQQQVKDNLERIGKLSLPSILPIMGAEDTIRYRNKIEYTFSNRRFLLASELHDPSVSAEGNVAGFHAKGIFDKIVDIDTCYLQEEPSNLIRLAVKEFALAHGLSFYDIRSHEGWLRTMQLRICTSGEVMVNIVFGHEEAEARAMLLDHIMERFPGLTTLLYTINSKWNDSMIGLTPKAYHGKGYVIEKMEDFQFKIGPSSFFQTNTRQGEKLYRVARDFAELSGRETVYDLYCGTGSIGIFVSRQAARIVGVELVPEAIEDARENAELNSIGHAEFFAGDVAELCDDAFFAAHGRPDRIITDPPRAGMHEKLVKKILEIRAPIVVYVSCNPATQARDLRLLDAAYSVEKVQPVDMFPHTHHIENVVQLKLKSLS